MKTALILFIFATVVASGTARRHHRGHHHHHGPPPPPYLKNVSAEARREYRKIVHNDTLTVAEQKKEINEWAEKYHIGEQVKKFDEKMKAHMDEVKKNVTKLIQFLPEALEKFSKIVEDENLTPKQIGERRHNLTAAYPEAFHVLKFVFKQFMPKHGPHGPHGGRHHGHHRRDDDDDSCCPMDSDGNNGSDHDGWRAERFHDAVDCHWWKSCKRRSQSHPRPSEGSSTPMRLNDVSKPHRPSLIVITALILLPRTLRIVQLQVSKNEVAILMLQRVSSFSGAFL